MRRRLLVTCACGAFLVPSTAVADRPAGHAFSWGQELRQQKLPGWRPKRNPYPAGRWTALVKGILTTAGRNGLWFSGSAALPFDLPIRDTEPIAGWFNRSTYLRLYRQTGLSFDVNLELRVAQLAKDRKLHTSWNIKNRIAARRYLMIGPGWQATALREIKRIVPKYRNTPYRNYYTGTDEPMIFPAAGPATRSALWRRMSAEIAARSGLEPPSSSAAATTDPIEGLRWAAFNAFTGDRYFTLRKQQVDLIHRLDPRGLVSTNSYAFIDGFIPWDYTRLGEFADIVELDPYTSYDEAKNPGRGRYNHGFGTKLMSDLTGTRIRTIVQAFPYQGYDPTPEDVWIWSSQALRAGATDLSLYGETNPRFTRPKVYRAMLAIAAAMKTARLPDPPVDPATVVVYATASEGQGRPSDPFAVRPRTLANQLYTTYSALGELAGSSFVFDADRRLTAEPARLARARTVWLPRGETLDRGFADALAAWVRSGGTLVVTDPDAFTRTPDNGSLADVRQALIGAAIGPAAGDRVAVRAATFGPQAPARDLAVAVAAAGAFTTVPGDATVVGTNADASPAVLRRPVGAGEVIAFAGDVMFPKTLDAPGDLTELVAAVQRMRGAPLGLPVWRYVLPGTPDPNRPPWPTAVTPTPAVYTP